MRFENASMIEAKSVPALPIRYRTPSASSISRKACAVFSTATVLRVLIVIACAPGYSIARPAPEKSIPRSGRACDPSAARGFRWRRFRCAKLSTQRPFNARRVGWKIAPRSRHDAPHHGPARLSRYARSRARNPGGARSRDGFHGLRRLPCPRRFIRAELANNRAQGRRDAATVGGPESHLEVLAQHDGRLAPIPFQVDEVLPDGRYALPDGPEPLSSDSPGILDRDDEIAMMLSDFGDRASSPPRELPPDALEIETVDAASGAHRYAYIAAVPSPRLSPASYVSYDPARSTIEGWKLPDDVSRRFSDWPRAEGRSRQTLAESHRGLSGAGDGARC